jgi:hypothetical protein
MAKENEQDVGEPIDDVVMEELRRAIGSIEFGSVLVKIHQGEVVGIETSTKVRLAHQRAKPDRE